MRDASPPESSRQPEPSLGRARVLAREALSATPAGVLTDFDGTLSPIVSDPAAARLVGGAAGSLARLAERLAVVAVVTGRAPADARRMTGVDGLLVAGNHGTEWLEPGADAPAPSPEFGEVRASIDALLARVPALSGVTIEDKGLSATVHYRTATDPEAARDTVLAALGDGADGIELRPVGLGDKGSATRAIVDRFGLRGAVVLGDDVTDLDMFAAVAQLRTSGRIRAAIIGVGGTDREVPPEVTAAADVVLASPAEAAALLEALADG